MKKASFFFFWFKHLELLHLVLLSVLQSRLLLATVARFCTGSNVITSGKPQAYAMIIISHTPKGALNKSTDVGTVSRLSPEVCEGIIYIEKYSLYSFSRKAPTLK